MAVKIDRELWGSDARYRNKKIRQVRRYAWATGGVALVNVARTDHTVTWDKNRRQWKTHGTIRRGKRGLGPILDALVTRGKRGKR